MIEMFSLFVLALSIVLVLIPHVVWVLLRIIGRLCQFTIPYAPFGYVALALVVFAWCILAYGFYVGRWRLQTTSVEYTHPQIPQSFDGMRIVHISDLHLSTFTDRPYQLQRFVDSINATHPDLVCFTGDIVSIGIEEMYPFTDILQQIHAPYGVASVLGNHDFLIYRRDLTEAEQETAVNELARWQTDSLHWQLLRNQSLRLTRGEDSMYILGVDNSNCADQGFRTIYRGDLQQAMCGTDGFRILLSHDPSHWTAEVVGDTNIPLTLSGHTHAAQIRIFGWTPAAWTFKQTQGLYQQGEQTLYINIGLGCTVPFRIGANPEITVITLRRPPVHSGK